MKSGLAAVIGRPSSGKSTLLNKICGHKVSITASSPQTTRNTVRGIYTDARGQIVFLDTPGYHISEKKMNLYLKNLATSSLEECDLILYVLDLTRSFGQEEEELVKMLSSSEIPVIAILNKSDLKPERDHIDNLEKMIRRRIPNSRTCAVSALQGTGVKELIDLLFEETPEGEMLYPEDYYTDQDPEFRISEIIREKTVNRVRQELPHAVYVEIEDLETRDNEETLWIRAVINVEKESQKGMVVGKKGSVIKEIRTSSQKELAELFPYKITLDLRVKVDPKWRRKDNLLKRMIF